VFTNITDGQTIRIRLSQDVVGHHAVTWPSGGAPTGIYWPGGTAHVMTQTPGAIDIITVSSIGNVLFGTFTQNHLHV
jgi:hypothetical protein